MHIFLCLYVVFDEQRANDPVRWSRALLRLCCDVIMRDDVIPTSCVIAAVAVCLHLAASCTSHLLVSGPVPPLLQLTGMAGVAASLRTHAVDSDDRDTVDVAALDSWYRQHMTFEIVNLAGVLQYFADGM